MNQCLRIIFSVILPKKFLENIQKNAKSLELEGVVQATQGPEHSEIRIVVCGSKNAIDDFVDYLHIEISDKAISTIEMEPFIKDKDYRGVFRIIE